MKDSGTPISLFSFQDIVTSLTGIMVIVILVIVLQLAEAIYDYENPKSDNPEYLELKAKTAELAARLKQLKDMGEEIPEELKPYIDVPEETVDSELQSTENAKAVMTAEKESNEKKLETIKLSIEQLKELLKATKEDKSKAEAKLAEVDGKLKAATEISFRELEDKLQTLLQESERLKNNIRIEADKVEFSFAGVMSRQPILIECTGNGFRAQVYKGTDGVKDFTGGGVKTNLPKLVAWLKQYDMKKCYPVLLLRRSAFAYLDDILAKLYDLGDDVALGMEPLDDKVTVF